METKEESSQLKAIAGRIKELRVKAGYSSYEKFAWDHDIEKKQYWRLEAGRNFMMTTLLRLLKIHGITLDEFFKGLK